MLLSEISLKALSHFLPLEMANSVAFSITFLSTTFSLVCISCFPPARSLSVETRALLEFKRGLVDPLRVLDSWKEEAESPCTFSGITCDRVSGKVTTISFDNQSLSGTLSPAITVLRSLEILSLPSNSLNGTIPRQLAECGSLKKLNLSGNYLVGAIPDLSPLKGLKILDLSLNYFSGLFPTWLGNLTGLVALGLGQNSFDEGQIPESIGQLKNLTWLFLSDSNLSGEIPESVFELYELDTLDLSRNKISGKFPKSISKLQKLTKIELWFNRLTGELPPDLANLTLLREFDASANNMHGELPEVIGNMKNLVVFQLYSNNFSGKLPAGFGEMHNLTSFSIYRNKFSGEFPPNFGRFSYLLTIDISENQFTGRFPEFLCEGRQLKNLLALQNSFSGEFPQSYAGCNTLLRFRINKNQLNGSIPDGVWSLPLANIIDLSDNDFSGDISPRIQNSTSLTELILYNNKFSGLIPSELGSLTNLERLTLNNNSLSGRIPPSLGDLKQLSSMHFEDNLLTGSIPSELGGCIKLVDLNLASNSLTGSIPNDLSKLSYLNSLNMSGNKLTGGIPEDLGKLKLSSVDLSENQLTGRVPPILLRVGGDRAFAGNKQLCVEGGSSNSYVSTMSKCAEKHDNGSTSGKFALPIIACTMAILLVGLFLANYKLKHAKEGDIERGCSSTETQGGGDPNWMLSSFHHLDIDADEISNIDEENLIGSGGNGRVYRLDLKKNGSTVAVKKLRKGDDDGLKVLSAEMEILGNIRHMNILKLYACLQSGGSSCLVFEYMTNGNLLEAIQRRGKGSLPELDWDQRYKIALGCAKAISYLHHDCSPPIVHRDIKSSNILLDEEYEPKLADFGVAKHAEISGSGSENSSFAGTHGYIAPEIAYSLKVTEKSDVYSFGVVLLELLTSQRPIDDEYGQDKDIVYWVSTHLGDRESALKVLDSKLATKTTQEGMMKVMKVAILCTNKLPNLRPSMREVVKMLVDADPRSFKYQENDLMKEEEVNLSMQ